LRQAARNAFAAHVRAQRTKIRQFRLALRHASMGRNQF
jgi:hypothetical protein